MAAITYPAECTSTSRPIDPRARHGNLTSDRSCEDEDTAQSEASRGAEAAMAAIRIAMVCRLHYSDHWQRGQGGYSYELDLQITKGHGEAKTLTQDLSHSTSTRRC